LAGELEKFGTIGWHLCLPARQMTVSHRVTLFLLRTTAFFFTSNRWALPWRDDFH